MVLLAACMLGAAPLRRVTAQVDLIEEFDCETYLATAPVKTSANIDVDQPYLTLDTNEIKTWNLGTSMTEGFTCTQQLVSSSYLYVIHPVLGGYYDSVYSSE